MTDKKQRNRRTKFKIALMLEGISMADIARQLGTTRQTIFSIINGKFKKSQYGPDIQTLENYLRGKYPNVFDDRIIASEVDIDGTF